MSSSISIMVLITPCFLELLSFVHENSPFLMVSVSEIESEYDQEIPHSQTTRPLEFDNGLYGLMASRVIALC